MLSLSKYLANFSSSHFSSKYLGDDTSLKPPLFYTPVVLQALIRLLVARIQVLLTHLARLHLLKTLVGQVKGEVMVENPLALVGTKMRILIPITDPDHQGRFLQKGLSPTQIGQTPQILAGTSDEVRPALPVKRNRTAAPYLSENLPKEKLETLSGKKS